MTYAHPPGHRVCSRLQCVGVCVVVCCMQQPRAYAPLCPSKSWIRRAFGAGWRILYCWRVQSRRWARWKLIVVGVVFGGIELTFLAANLTKIVHGGWLPLLVAAVVITVMSTWQRGRQLITARRIEIEVFVE